MRRTVLATGVLLLAGLCAQAYAQVVVPLERKPLAAGRTAAFWAQKYVESNPTRPASVKAVPELTGTACYMTADLGGRTTTMLLDLSSKPKLYVDTDHDGDLAEEQAFTGKGTGGDSGGLLGALLGSNQQRSFSFDSVTLALKDPDATCEIALEGSTISSGRVYATLRPAAVRAGRADLGGKERQVQVMDGTFDGRYDSAFNSPAGNSAPAFAWDVLFVDADGDGRLMTTTMSSGEVMPLPRLVNVGGSWYGVTVAADGSSVTFAPVDPPMGKLDVDSKQVELDLFSDSGYHRLAKSEGGWQLPAGSYMAVSLRLLESVSGTTWTMSSDWPDGQLRAFSVQPDATTAIKVGPPLVSSVTFIGSGSVQMLGYELKGRAGEQYGAGAERRGVMQPAPAFVILDKDDKKLASGSFEYG